jgi:hypothetical protein
MCAWTAAKQLPPIQTRHTRSPSPFNRDALTDIYLVCPTQALDSTPHERAGETLLQERGRLDGGALPNGLGPGVVPYALQMPSH